MKPQDFLRKITLPLSDSRKGQNGKLLIIGGSELFHAAGKWSLDVASNFVDMVFYSSVPSNNELIHEAKKQFWNGIVVSREDLDNYFQESDAILIGPGMDRSAETTAVVNTWLKKYPQKKWVIDAGALQMVDPQLLTPTCILTPHLQELYALNKRTEKQTYEITDLPLPFDPAKHDEAFEKFALENLFPAASKFLNGVTLIFKGAVDVVTNTQRAIAVPGGNAGMTKGGTGDVLAGLVAALYCAHDALTAAVVGSYINKKAGDELYQSVGPFFNASALVEMVPKVLWAELSKL